MTRPSLPRFRSRLRRLFPGKENAWLRSQVNQTAETWVRRPKATADSVRSRIAQAHSGRLGPAQLDELCRALDLDMPEAAAEGGAA